ncbi:MAG TPA: TIGR03435 family protein, partial [Bryobacteraceae bacterium]|nr:TIGR03435 family protein [Bryobacteraceae bacterium]
DPSRISYTNIPLRRVLLAAYEVSNYQILGPDWLNSLRFDITAKVSTGVTKEQFQSMLRNLLATRFQMATHLETKELPIYALVAAKNGAKLKPAVDDEAGKSPQDQLPVVTQAEGKDGFPTVSLPAAGLVIETKDGRARVTAKRVTMAKFADYLSGRLDRPVIDMTGLAATYSFALYFAPEGASPDVGSEPGIFGAVQEQLGLRLEARKGSVQFLMIDHAEKVPTGN